MFEDVAVPYIQKLLTWRYRRSMRKIEALNDARDIAGIGFYGVLVRGALVAFGRHGPAGKDELAGLLIGLDIKGLPVQDLELDEVHVQRMNVGGGVDEGPYLCAAGPGIFGDGFVPARIAQETDDDVAVGTFSL